MLNKDNRMYIILLSIFFIFNINTVEARTIYANLLNNHEITAKYEHGGKGYQAIGKDSYKMDIRTENGKFLQKEEIISHLLLIFS